MFFRKFPYTSFSELNLDWIINKIKSLELERIPIARPNTIGGIKPGETVTVSEDGTLDVRNQSGADGTEYVLPVSSNNTLGGVKVGNGLEISQDGTLSVKQRNNTTFDVNVNSETNINSTYPETEDYTLPIASEDTLGGIKIGNGLDIDPDGTVNVSLEDDAEYVLPIASPIQLGAIKVGQNLEIEEDGTLNAFGEGSSDYILPTASEVRLGGIKVGQNLQVEADGTLNAFGEGSSDYVLPTATDTRLGGVKVGNGLEVEADGTINVTGGSSGGGDGDYTLPIASEDTLGGIKIGNGLEIESDGTVNVTGGGGSGEGSDYTLPIASDTTLGGIKIGEGLEIEEDGTVNVTGGDYTLPAATATRLGGIKVGDGLTVDTSGRLSTLTVDTNIKLTFDVGAASTTGNMHFDTLQEAFEYAVANHNNSQTYIKFSLKLTDVGEFTADGNIINNSNTRQDILFKSLITYYNSDYEDDCSLKIYRFNFYNDVEIVSNDKALDEVRDNLGLYNCHFYKNLKVGGFQKADGRISDCHLYPECTAMFYYYKASILGNQGFVVHPGATIYIDHATITNSSGTVFAIQLGSVIGSYNLNLPYTTVLLFTNYSTTPLFPSSNKNIMFVSDEYSKNTFGVTDQSTLLGTKYFAIV